MSCAHSYLGSSHAYFLVLHKLAAGVARLVAQFAPVLIDAYINEFAVTIELVKFLADLIDAVGCCPFATQDGVLIHWLFARCADR